MLETDPTNYSAPEHGSDHGHLERTDPRTPAEEEGEENDGTGPADGHGRRRRDQKGDSVDGDEKRHPNDAKGEEHPDGGLHDRQQQACQGHG